MKIIVIVGDLSNKALNRQLREQCDLLVGLQQRLLAEIEEIENISIVLPCEKGEVDAVIALIGPEETYIVERTKRATGKDARDRDSPVLRRR